MYRDGKGVPQDYKEAMRLFRLAAEHEWSSAQASLGKMYYEGPGAPQDCKEAVRLFRLAAEEGDGLGQNDLGAMFYEGCGVPQDYIQAHMWFNLAGASGETAGFKNRDMVAAMMTPEEIAEAQRLAREWKPKTGH